jgi:hypothetical protein
VIGHPHNAVRHLTPSRARVALVLSVLLLFFGIALFSPLHQHKLGKTPSCSFNNLEHQLISLAEAAIVLTPVAHIMEAGEPPAVSAPITGLSHDSRDRAPPAHS